MKKVLAFISLLFSFLCVQAKPLFLEESEILDLKSRALFDDPMPSKMLALHYDYYGESESDMLKAAVFYYINGEFGIVRSTLRSWGFLLARLKSESKYINDLTPADLEKLEGEDALLLDLLKYKIALKEDEDTSGAKETLSYDKTAELRAYLESKKVNKKLLEDDRRRIISYPVGDGENLFEEEKAVYYDLLLTANPVLLKGRANPSLSAVNIYIRSILQDKDLLFSDGALAKYFAKHTNIKTTYDIFSIESKEQLEALESENSMYSNFFLMQFYLFRGQEEAAEKYKNFLKKRGVAEKLLYPYAIHEARIFKISITRLPPIGCKIIE